MNGIDEKSAGFIRMKELKEKGRKVVGFFCSYTPLELVEAAGAEAVALCGSSEEGIADAEKVLPKTLCPLIKASYGLAVTDKCPYFYFSDMILAETTCDGKKKMYELMAEVKPTHVMQLPQGMSSEMAIDFWESEIHRAKEKIEEILGAVITEENLRRAIHLKNQVRQATLRFYELGKLNPSPISVKQMMETLDWVNYAFDDEAVIQRLNQLTDEYEAEYRSMDKTVKRPRILITGCPTGGVREKVLYQIEEAGASVVGFENCGGPRCQKDLVDETKEPYRALAEKYLRLSCSVMSPNHGRFQYMEEMLGEYQIDGVIEVVLHGCHTFAVEAYKVEHFVKDVMKIPYMRIDADFSKADAQQIKTRLSAFIEMIDS